MSQVNALARSKTNLHHAAAVVYEPFNPLARSSHKLKPHILLDLFVLPGASTV